MNVKKKGGLNIVNGKGGETKIMVGEELIEKAIRTAMEELNISKKIAIYEFLIYMCGHGTVDDFKDVINYYIKNQDILLKKKVEKN